MMQTVSAQQLASTQQLVAQATTFEHALLPGIPSAAPLLRVRRLERGAWLVAGATLVALGFRSRVAPVRTSLLVLGGLSAFRGARGTFTLSSPSSTTGPKRRVVRVHAQVTIDATPTEVYQLWRRFERLPSLMTHLESVVTSPSGESTWVVRTPLRTEVRLLSRLTEDRPGELIAWKSIDDSDVVNDGSVRFQVAPGGRGTEVRVEIAYVPPGGTAGDTVLKLLGRHPEQLVSDELRRLKQLVEAGEISTVEGQTSGRKSERRVT